MQWVLIGEVLSALARASNQVGAQPAIPRYLDMLAAIIERGAEGAAELNVLKMHIQMMVQDDREPTEDEWADLQGRSDAAHDAIQSVDLSEDDGNDDDETESPEE